MEQPKGMQFAQDLHEMLCADYANTPDEAAAMMDRHADYIAECVAVGTNFARLRACAVALEEKEASWREEQKKEESKPKAKKPKEAAKSDQIQDPRGTESFPELATG